MIISEETFIAKHLKFSIRYIILTMSGKHHSQQIVDFVLKLVTARENVVLEIANTTCN